MFRFVVISGCSGGGKSTLLEELRSRGEAVVEEPGRRIVQEEQERGGSALPWIDLAAFARRAISTALADRQSAVELKGWVFFDRGLVDAAAALEHASGEAVLEGLGKAHRYHPRVFLAPPWPETYRVDRERQHEFGVAEEEYLRLLRAYRSLGYEIALLPKVSVVERADFVLGMLKNSTEAS